MTLGNDSVLWLCLLLLAPVPDKPDETSRDLERLQGTWEFVSIEAEGEKAPPEMYKGALAVIKGAKITMGLGDKTETATIELDATKNPRWMQTTSQHGDVLLGIYKIEKDKLTFCLSKVQNDRPKEFATKKGVDHGLFVLKKKS